jgi:uncharacterized protein
MNAHISESNLNTIFHECRQCGTCCKKYRKVTLYADEVLYIKKMGGHVGVNISMQEIWEKELEQATADAEAAGKIFMVHPDEKGCVFMEQRNEKYYCKIYHYRPRTCRGFKCNMADDSFFSLFADDATSLLGQDRFGLPLIKV